MTTPDPAAAASAGAPPAVQLAAFDELMGEVLAPGEHFGHREHVRLTWLAVTRYGTPAAVGLLDAGLRRTARSAGVPEKFHVTMTRAWVELVGLAAAEGDRVDFDGFVARHPDLLDRNRLFRHYRAQTLAGERSRTGWVEPDLAPLTGPSGE